MTVPGLNTQQSDAILAVSRITLAGLTERLDAIKQPAEEDLKNAVIGARTALASLESAVEQRRISVLAADLTDASEKVEAAEALARALAAKVPKAAESAKPTPSRAIALMAWALICLTAIAAAVSLVGAQVVRDDHLISESCSTSDPEEPQLCEKEVATHDEDLALSQTRMAAAVALASITVFLGALMVLNPRGARSLGPAVGKDRRLSASLLQTYLWTLIIATVLIWAMVYAFSSKVRGLDDILGDDWTGYLILLGGPFAAAAIAKGTTTFKLADGTIQQVSNDPSTSTAATSPPTTASGSATSPPAPGGSSPTTLGPGQVGATQALGDDDGSFQLVDTQYMLFNLIAMGYVIASVLRNETLPVIPAVLLGLTSGSAAAYAANRAVAKNPPIITSVSPPSARPGTTVRVDGKNLAPGGTSTLNSAGVRVWPTISLTGFAGTVTPLEGWTDERLEFDVPLGAGGGNQQVMITSTAGVQTAPKDLQIVSVTPTTISVEGEVRPEGTLTIVGDGLTERYEVDGIPGAAPVSGPTGKQTITISLPPVISGETVRITLYGSDGLATKTLELPVSKPVITSVARTTNDGLEAFGTGWWSGTSDGCRIRVNGTQLQSPDWGPAADGSGPRQRVTTKPLTNAGIAVADELQVVVVDRLGRASSPYILPKQ